MSRRRSTFASSVQGGSSELTRITCGLVAVCGLGFAASVAPIVEHVLDWFFSGSLTAGVLIVLGRWAARHVRERAEDRADLAALQAGRAAQGRVNAAGPRWSP